MKMIPVDSSMIRAVGYDRATRTLEVLFASGKTYLYQDVPQTEHKGLMAAGSKGSYMLSNIIDMYPWHEQQPGGRKRANVAAEQVPTAAKPRGGSRSKTVTKSGTFAERYPNIANWVENYGRIEIGHDDWMNCFVLATDEGGTAYQGKATYDSLEEALEDLDSGIGEYLMETGM